MNTNNQRSQFKNQIGFILSALGAAIGLGGIWRFAYLAYEGGGSAFMIAYVVSVILLGGPLVHMEFGLGNSKHGSAPLVFAKYNRKWEWLGWWNTTYNIFGLLIFYTMLMGWCIAFFTFSFDMSWGSNPQAFFNNDFLNKSNSATDFGSIQWNVLLFGVIGACATWFISYRGLGKGIEITNKILMPILGISMVTLFVWSLNLEGAMIGLKQYFVPDLSKLATPKVWFNAFGHAFFSLSLMFGIMINYASYMDKKSDLTKAATAAIYGTAAFNVFSGCIVFAILGFMSKTQGIPIEQLIKSSAGLAFIVYPQGINEMAQILTPFGAKIYAIIFFSCLIMAGLSTTIAHTEAALAGLSDKFKVSRKSGSTAIAMCVAFGCIFYALQSGTYWISIIDTWVVGYGLIIAGILQCIFIGWKSDLNMLREHLNQHGSIQLGDSWNFRIKYIGPPVLIFLALYCAYSEINATSNMNGQLLGIAFSIILLLAGLWIAKKPWKDPSVLQQ